MSRLGFFTHYALKRLYHGGQRVFIALLAVAFGVMSLIAMVSLSETLKHTLTSPPRIALGGDMLITRPDDDLTAADLGDIAQAQAAGLLTAYTPVSAHFSLLMRTSDSGKARFIQRGIGINPAVYPLAGELLISQPSDQPLAMILSETGSVVITRDLVTQYGIAIGDTIRLALPDGIALPHPLTVRGIADDTPTHYGQSLYYSLDTASALFGEGLTYIHVVANTTQPDAVTHQFSAAGWGVVRADRSTSYESGSAQSLFDLMLRGAGVMGLIVGGIGIANTMQVLVAQRRHEVGILKTLGCSQRDMLYIALLEVCLLGGIGGVLGAAAGQVIAERIIAQFAATTSLLMRWEFNLPLTLSGIGIGLLTTILFGFYAIYRTSQIRPTVIFRQEDIQVTGWAARLRPLRFYAVLLFPFTGLTSVIMGAVSHGVGVVLIALGGLIIFGVLLGVSSRLVLQVMPTFGNPLLRMARNNMRKRALSLLFAMIALFIGIFTLGFASTVIQVGFVEFNNRQLDNESNIMVYVSPQTAPLVIAMLAQSGATDISEVPPSQAIARVTPQHAIYAHVPPTQEMDIAQQVGDAFPDSMTLTRSDVSAEVNRTFNNLFGLAIAMAGLALLAGVMLVANVVSLALIERRYEIGVMKAVGYTRRHILTVLGLEYGVMGCITSGLALVGVQLAVSVITMLEEAAVDVLVVRPPLAVMIVALGILLTLMTVIASAWQPATDRPRHLLNQMT